MRRLWAVVLLGVVLRVVPWLQPHTFLGVQESDDGVYYGASRLLLDGLMPYADYAIVHPPGVSLLLAPFAALGAATSDPVGLAAARVAVVLVAVANTLLVHRLALRLPMPEDRRQPVALAAAAVYAVMPNAVIAEHTVLLEPVVTVFGLLALLALLRSDATRTGALLAGVCCALAVSVKLFACLYVLALLGWLLVPARRRLLPAFVAGAAGTTAAVVLPFFLLAPGTFWHDVVVTQARRPLDETHSGPARLADMMGLGPLGAVAGSVLLVVAVVAVVRTQGRPSPPYLVGLFLLGTGAFAFLTSPSYFPHYGAFLAPVLAVVVSRSLVRPGRDGVAAVLGVIALLTAGSVVHLAKTRGQDDFAQVGRVVEPGSCVFAELASLAVAADVFAAPTQDCPGWLDGRGVAYTWNTDWPRSESFYPAGFVRDARWQGELREQLAAADYLLLKSAPGDVPEWDGATRAYSEAHFAHVLTLEGPGHAHGQLWRREG